MQLAFVATLLSLVSPSTSFGAECASLRSGLRPAAADSIGLLSDSRLPPRVLAEAAAAWSICGASAAHLPRLVVGRHGTRDLFVEYRPEAIGRRGRCGEFAGRTITLFARTRRTSGKIVFCGSLAQNLAHEVGHALGLADAPRTCDSFAMSKLHPKNGFDRRVQPSECALLARRWVPLPRRSHPTRSSHE